MIKVLINNKFVPPSKAKVSVLGSFGRGYGVFETFKVFDHSKILELDAHIKRLLKSAKKIDLKIKYKENDIKKMVRNIAKSSPHKVQRIKIMAIEEALIIISWPHKENKTRLKKGVSCMALKCVRRLPEVKSISYIDSFLSHERANKKGYFEAILIDEKGEVYEGAYSNIFWFEGNTLCTRKDSVLPGITKQLIQKISPFKINFKKIKISDIKKCSEVFITSSVIDITPVVKINNKLVGTGKPGKNTNELIAALQALKNTF